MSQPLRSLRDIGKTSAGLEACVYESAAATIRAGGTRDEMVSKLLKLIEGRDSVVAWLQRWAAGRFIDLVDADMKSGRAEVTRQDAKPQLFLQVDDDPENGDVAAREERQRLLWRDRQRLRRRRKAQGLRVIAVEVPTIFDTIKVSGRGSWGDIVVGQLRAIAVEGTRDAAIAKQLLRDVPIGTSTMTKVRDVTTLSLFQRAVQKAAEVVDDAFADENVGVGP